MARAYTLLGLRAVSRGWDAGGAQRDGWRAQGEATAVQLVEGVTSRTRSVLVIDDQRIFADAMVGALGAQPDVDVLGVAYDLDTALTLLEQHVPDVVVLDVHFEGDSRDGVEMALEVRDRHPGARVLLLSAMADPSIVWRAAAAGVSAVMAKDGSLDEVLRAIRAEGLGFTVDPLLLEDGVATTVDPRAPVLSPRESDVLAMLVLGMDARAISNHLDISMNTCRSYIKTLLAKFGAHSQLECVAMARRMGMDGRQRDQAAPNGTRHVRRTRARSHPRAAG